MDFGKLRGSGKGQDKNSAPSGSSKNDLPSSVDGGRNGGPGPGGKKPKSITETNAWRQGMGGFRSMWSQYLGILASSFRNMNRGDQEALITRICQVITVGCAFVITNFFYQFLPTLVRLFGFPVVVVGAWFLATKVIAPIMISQFESKLNRP